jgi:hypothetical protein
MKRAVPIPRFPKKTPLSPSRGFHLFPARRNHFRTPAQSSGNRRGRSLMLDRGGPIMLSIIFNAIYGHFIEAALPGMTRQGPRS